MKKFTIKAQKAIGFENNAIKWQDTEIKGVCASSKSVNITANELRDKNELVKDVRSTDFYVDPEIIEQHLLTALKECGIADELLNATVAHMLNCLDKGVCFKR